MIGLCRLCASIHKKDVLMSIKDDCNEICEKLRKCCQLNIKMNDGLPKSICQNCIYNLNNSHEFYEKVKEAQETLQVLYPYPTNGKYSDCTNASAHTSIVQTLSAHKVTLKKHTSAANQDEQKLAKEHEDVAENSMQKTEPENSLFGQSKNCMNESNAYENNTAEKDAHAKITCHSSFEIQEPIEGDVEYLIANVSGSDSNSLLQNQFTEEVKNELLCSSIIPNKEALLTVESANDSNDLMSDDEINIEVECIASYEDEEEDNDTGQICTDIEKSKLTLFSTSQKTINSWKNYKFLCFICNHILGSFVDLKNHVAQAHDITQLNKLQYKCYDCKKTISRYSNFLNHVRSRHHSDLKLKCDACDLTCQNYEELASHRSVDCTEAMNYAHTAACNVCFKSFPHFYGLQNHVKHQHNPFKTLYNCTQCNKEFQYKSCLKSHELLHTGTKRFSCNYCDRSFYNKMGLDQHLYVHVEEKAFQCNICNKSYKTFQNLDCHQRLHTEEKAFKCQFCNRCFSRKIQKITHERCHTGEMPYSCEQCNKRFRHRSALFVHNKIHTGHKPYSCEYCDRTFADSSNRNKHVRRMHSKDKR